MADNGFKINKSVNLNPQTGAPANPVDGDIYYDSTAQSFAYYSNGAWANFDSVGTVASTLWLTGAQFTPAVVRNSVIKVTGGVVLSHLAGISSSFSARKITIYNAGTATIVVEPEDANEPTANNRIQTPTGGSMNLVAGEIAVFTYDIVASRWLLVSISSNAGAQIIATTSNPGLVTLHQASLVPLDGVVLSDGDLNTANGVVGLNASSQVTIDLVFNALARRVEWPEFSIGEATVNTFHITGPATGFVEFFDSAAATYLSLVNVSGVSAGLVAQASGWAELSMSAHPLRIVLDGSHEWTFNTNGTLTSVNQNKILNIADPTLAQDVATKNYVDKFNAWGFQTGFTDISVATTATRPQSSAVDNGYVGNMVTNGVGTTAWSISTPTGYVYRVQGRISFYVQAVGGSTSNITLDFKPTTASLIPVTGSQIIYAQGGTFAAGQRYQVPFSYYIYSNGDEAYFTIKCNASTLTLQEVDWDFYVTRIS